MANTNCAALAYTGALQAELRYDPIGRLYEVSGGAPGTQRFAYDGNALIGEYDNAGNMLRRYVHGSNIDADDPLIVYEGAAVSDAARRYLHADPRGSIVAVTNYQGTSIATNSYDEFGIPDSASGTDIASKGRFRYTGQAWLPELGMYYYKARIYSPTLGRFLQTDPIGYEDQFNLYAYVGNDPVNGTDPTGLDTEISLVAYPLPGIAGWFGYGHSYVRYRDTETGEVRVARAGPSEPYDGGSTGAINNTPSPNGATIEAIDTPLGESVDRPSQNPGTRTLQSVTVKTPFDQVRGTVGKINEQINNAETPYEPQGNNSNRYAGDVFESLTGTDVDQDTPIELQGLDDGNLPRRLEPR